MLYRYDPAEAARQCKRWSETHSESLAERLYTARLLASEPSLAVHDRAVASVKCTAVDAFGERVAVLWVNVLERGLASLEPEAMVACRLSAIERLGRSPLPDEAQLFTAIRSAALDPWTPEPPLAALLHALLPAPFVDQTAPEAVLQLVHQPEARQLCQRVFGERLLFVPEASSYVALVRSVLELWQRYQAERGVTPDGILLDKRGLVTWGESAEQSYARTIEIVSVAERAVAVRLEPASAIEYPAGQHEEERRGLGLALRGAMQRASGRCWIASWLANPELIRFSRRNDLSTVPLRACATPEEVIWTKPLMWLVEGRSNGHSEALGERFDQEIAQYARTYQAYVAAASEASGRTADEVDPWPRVALLPGLGAVCFGRTLRESRLIAQLVDRAARVLDGASAVSQYAPPTELTLFHAEHLNPEHRRWRRSRPPLRALDGRVAMIIGAASGTGVATTRAMLEAGAHVLITAQDARVAETICETYRERYPDRLLAVACDVTSDSACARAVQVACDTFGGIDILVSNTGTAPSGLLHTESGDTALRLSLEVNLLGHQRAARAASEAMVTQGSGGALLFNASKSAFVQGPAFGPYAVPKAALLALMRQYAIDLGPHAIRSNAVNADRVRIKLHGSADPTSADEPRELSPSEYFRSNLLCRETMPESVAEAFLYLSLAEATTGCVVTVDGGNPGAFPR